MKYQGEIHLYMDIRGMPEKVFVSSQIDICNKNFEKNQKNKKVQFSKKCLFHARERE